MKRSSAGFSLPITALELGGKRPIYRQLYDWFQRAIVEGRLRPGQRVPSTRRLAAELKISRIPVLTAFEQLHAEGYLESVVGAGTRVAASMPQQSVRFAVRQLAEPGVEQRARGAVSQAPPRRWRRRRTWRRRNRSAPFGSAFRPWTHSRPTSGHRCWLATPGAPRRS